MKVKFWLTIVLVVAVCGLAGHIVVFETGWVVANEQTEQVLEGTDVSETIRKAKAYHKAGQTEKAIEILHEALEKDPDNFVLTIELGKSYEQNGDIDLAVSAYEKASSINPDHYLPYKPQ